MLSRDYWGRGLMTEAVKAVIEYGFDTLGIEVFTIGHFFENDRSRRVMKNGGSARERRRVLRGAAWPRFSGEEIYPSARERRA